jgi:hypothetical protein
MAANTSPIFVGTPKAASVNTGLSANTALDGTGSVAILWTAGSNGSRIDNVYLTHLGTNVATVVRFFMDPAGGTAYKLLHEETMAANSLSQVAASVPVVWNANLTLPSGAKLVVTIGTAIASGILCFAVGGDF